MNFIAVALGGALGAMARYAISLIPIKSSFPLLTLFTNLVGAVLIGVIIGIAAKKQVQSHWMLFWKTGICGGFTTFSTFSLEALELFQGGKAFHGGLYAVLSVSLCILGVALGQLLGQRFFQS